MYVMNAEPVMNKIVKIRYCPK